MGALQKKICMVGSFAVGKTSLVERYVRSIFSEEYKTTIGVKIDKKTLQVQDRELALILWDLHGEDEFQKLRRSYLRGSSGYFLVADTTRPETLERGLRLHGVVRETIGEVPFALLLNKSDLEDQWELEEARIRELEQQAWTIIRTSAKSGQGVENAFQRLAEAILAQ